MFFLKSKTTIRGYINVFSKQQAPTLQELIDMADDLENSRERLAAEKLADILIRNEFKTEQTRKDNARYLLFLEKLAAKQKSKV